MDVPEASSSWRRAAPLATIFIVVAALYLARELFLPFAVASLFTFLLAPVVSGLQRLRLPRVVAVVVTVLVSLGGVVALGATVVGQLDELSEQLPAYKETIKAKVSALGGAVQSIERGLSETIPAVEPKDAAEPPSASHWTEVVPGFVKPKVEPLLVRVVPPRPSPFELVSDIAGPVLGPLGSLAIVFVLVLFMLIYLEDLRDRVVRVLSGRDVTVTTQAMSDVSQRISRYLFMTLVVNMSYGIPIGIGLALLGIPNAFLWGLLATFLRFIPYIGPWLGAAMPAALSFAIAPGWGLTAGVIGMFLVIELIVGNVVEPWLYGSRTGLSPLAIIFAAVFWTWLWGILGLLLSVPLTLIVVVSGRYIPSLRFLHTLFGDSPGLGSEARFYQRLVARDPDDASRIAEEFLDRKPLPDLYDSVVIPALRSLKYDESHLRLKADQVELMRTSLVELLGDMPAIADKKAKRRQKLADSERVDPADTNGLQRIEASASSHAGPVVDVLKRDARVVFVPADDQTDAVVGLLLADLLRKDGITLETIAPNALSNELVEAGLRGDPDVIIVGGFPAGGVVRLRHLVGRFVERRQTRVVAALWDACIDDVVVGSPPTPARLVRFGRRVAAPTVLSQVQRSAKQSDQRNVTTLAEVGAQDVVHTLSECAEAVRRALRQLALGIVA